MKQEQMQDQDAPGLESMLKLKLEVLLHDLLGKHGPVEVAKKLDVNYKTVARGVSESGHAGGQAGGGDPQCTGGSAQGGEIRLRFPGQAAGVVSGACLPLTAGGIRSPAWSVTAVGVGQLYGMLRNPRASDCTS